MALLHFRKTLAMVDVCHKLQVQLTMFINQSKWSRSYCQKIEILSSKQQTNKQNKIKEINQIKFLTNVKRWWLVFYVQKFASVCCIGAPAHDWPASTLCVVVFDTQHPAEVAVNSSRFTRALGTFVTWLDLGTHH